MGDFNCDAAHSPAFDILTTETGLIDTWTAAAKSTPVPTPNTFNGFKPPVFEGKRIDWVLARNPVNVTCTPPAASYRPIRSSSPAITTPSPPNSLTELFRNVGNSLPACDAFVFTTIT